MLYRRFGKPQTARDKKEKSNVRVKGKENKREHSGQ